MFRLILSTDGKHSLIVEAEKVESQEQLEQMYAQARFLYDKIVTDLGTKPALWEEVMNGNGQKGKRERTHLKAEDCPHDGGTLTLESHSERNPGRKFYACAQCQKFIRWVDPLIQ